MVEFGDLEGYEDTEIIPLVLYSRDEVINGPKKHKNLGNPKNTKNLKEA